MSEKINKFKRAKMNLLILSSSTGGGHNMRANALKYWWEKEGGSALVSLPLENSSPLYRMGSNFYNSIQKYYPALHFLYFNFLELASLHRNKKLILGTRDWLKSLSGFKPNLVVSVHAHLNHGYFEVLRDQFQEKLKFAIYCGELSDGIGFSRHWINPKADYFFGPFEETLAAAIKRGMPKEKTAVVGPLLRKGFYQRISSEQTNNIYNKYNISSDIPVFILGTGANGVNRHLKVVHSLAHYQLPFQVVALCGSNEKIYTEILAQKKLFKFKVYPLKTIDDCEMAFFLQHAAFLFSRPGAGSVTEAIVCGTPVIFDTSRGIMPQEMNNLNFWRNRATSIVSCRNPNRISNLINADLPSIKIKVESSPSALISKLQNLIE